jgi:phosphopentomutase
VPWDWTYFPDTHPSFPPEISGRVAELAGTEGILGDCHASGTEIIQELGARHIETGWPICYTSADSVFQIAAHEKSFGLERLLDLCAKLAPELHERRVGRVIARPFVGSAKTGFNRTTNRHDYAMETPVAALCEWVQQAGRKVHAIGKINDIFSGKGMDTSETGEDRELVEFFVKRIHTAEEGSLTFANLVEFDSLYGHRRNVSGYARALEWFDRQVPRMITKMHEGDLLIITADHGNDPTWRGTDHTRERVPIIGLVKGGAMLGDRGLRDYADIAATVADHLGIENQGPGASFL